MVGGPRRVLDLGSGTGRLRPDAATRGPRGVLHRPRRRIGSPRLPNGSAPGCTSSARSSRCPICPAISTWSPPRQTLHQFAPGLALTEIARVLKPGGHLAVGVQHPGRHRAVGQAADRPAAAGRPGGHARRLRDRVGLGDVTDSPYFTDWQRKNFRNWVPITRTGLVTMVERRPAVAKLDPTRDRPAARGRALYDSIARPPEPLLLPFQTSCWRAEVDHSGLVSATTTSTTFCRSGSDPRTPRFQATFPRPDQSRVMVGQPRPHARLVRKLPCDPAEHGGNSRRRKRRSDTISAPGPSDHEAYLRIPGRGLRRASATLPAVRLPRDHRRSWSGTSPTSSATTGPATS